MKINQFSFNKLKFVNSIYWIFLTYLVAAFIWWYVSLEKQNSEIANIKFQSISLNDPALYAKVKSIEAFELRKSKQYIGEGLTFLFLFLKISICHLMMLVMMVMSYSKSKPNQI